jgi:purine catabolism regulator
MYPTVADVLALPVIREGRPKVVAGAAGLERRIRWVHVAEVADIAHLLRGGELVLTTGIALPDNDDALSRYVDELAEVGAAGIVIELLHHWSDALPEAFVAAAERRGLPLVTLAKETHFVAVTEAVVGPITDAQVGELRAAEQVHQTFTALTVAGAEPSEVLHEVAQISGLPVVLETLSHDVLAYNTAGTDPAALLADWAQRSRAVHVTEQTGYDEWSGWLVTAVGARGNDWGRLVLLCREPPSHRHIVVAERAASALAVHRLVARDRESLERHAHRTVLNEILSAPRTSTDLLARSAALGVPLEHRKLIGLAVRPRTIASASLAPAMATQEVLRDLAEATANAARRARISALVGVEDDTSVRALLSLSPQASPDAALGRLADEVHRPSPATPRVPPVAVGVGTSVDGVTDARRTLVEAAHVADAALRSNERPYHRLEDVRLRGLLHLLADDERVCAFVDRELGPLLARPRDGDRLIDTLRHYCQNGGNKSAAAGAAHMSRTAYYQHLARIEQVLGVSLQAPESMLSLHMAILALDVRSEQDA